MLSMLVLSSAYCVVSAQAVDSSVAPTQVVDDCSLLQVFVHNHKRQLPPADPDSLMHLMQRVANSFKRGAVARLTPDEVEAALVPANLALTMLPTFQQEHAARGQKLVDIRFQEIKRCHEDIQFGEGVMAMHAERVSNALAARDKCIEAQAPALEKETLECGGLTDDATDLQRHGCRMATIQRQDHAKLCAAKTVAYDQMSCMHSLSCTALVQCQKSKIEAYNTVLADETAGLAPQQQEYQRMVRTQCLVQLIDTASQTGNFIDEESIAGCQDVKAGDLSVTPPGLVPAIVECPALQNSGPACDGALDSAAGKADASNVQLVVQSPSGLIMAPGFTGTSVKFHPYVPASDDSRGLLAQAADLFKISSLSQRAPDELSS